MTPVPTTPAAISFLDFLRLRYLAIEVPGFVGGFAPSVVREAFRGNPRGPSAAPRFDEYWRSHLLETTRAMPFPGLVRRRNPLERTKKSKIGVEAKKKNLK